MESTFLPIQRLGSGVGDRAGFALFGTRTAKPLNLNVSAVVEFAAVANVWFGSTVALFASLCPTTNDNNVRAIFCSVSRSRATVDDTQDRCDTG